MKLIIKVLALTAICGVSISAFAEKTIAVEASKVAAATSAPVVDAAQKQGQTVIVSQIGRAHV